MWQNNIWLCKYMHASPSHYSPTVSVEMSVNTDILFYYWNTRNKRARKGKKFTSSPIRSCVASDHSQEAGRKTNNLRDATQGEENIKEQSG